MYSLYCNSYFGFKKIIIMRTWDVQNENQKHVSVVVQKHGCCGPKSVVEQYLHDIYLKGRIHTSSSKIWWNKNVSGQIQAWTEWMSLNVVEAHCRYETKKLPFSVKSIYIRLWLKSVYHHQKHHTKNRLISLQYCLQDFIEFMLTWFTLFLQYIHSDSLSLLLHPWCFVWCEQ